MKSQASYPEKLLDFYHSIHLIWARWKRFREIVALLPRKEHAHSHGKGSTYWKIPEFYFRVWQYKARAPKQRPHTWADHHSGGSSGYEYAHKSFSGSGAYLWSQPGWHLNCNTSNMLRARLKRLPKRLFECGKIGNWPERTPDHCWVERRMGGYCSKGPCQGL